MENNSYIESYNKIPINSIFIGISKNHIKMTNIISTTKVCSKCKTSKNILHFNKSKFNKEGYRGKCKKCEILESKLYRRTLNGLITSMYSDQKHNSKYRKDNPPNYSKQELQDWVFSKPNFKGLYNNWVKSGYKKDLKPSCDRLDDYKSYALENLQLITWEDNYRKHHQDRINGVNNKASKSCIGVHKISKEIIYFVSAHEASRVTNINNSSISKCCKGIYKSAGGYVWKYK